MGRNRKSSEDLERTGAFRKNPQRGRARAAEPIVADPLGEPPADFLSQYSPTARDHLAAWHELREQTKEVRVTRADRTHFEMTARLMVRCRRSGANTGEFAQLNRFLAQLGLNPEARSRVEGEGGSRRSAVGEDTAEWAEFSPESPAIQ